MLPLYVANLATLLLHLASIQIHLSTFDKKATSNKSSDFFFFFLVLLEMFGDCCGSLPHPEALAGDPSLAQQTLPAAATAGDIHPACMMQTPHV